jgi:hypothetical protein
VPSSVVFKADPLPFAKNISNVNANNAIRHTFLLKMVIILHTHTHTHTHIHTPDVLVTTTSY